MCLKFKFRLFIFNYIPFTLLPYINNKLYIIPKFKRSYFFTKTLPNFAHKIAMNHNSIMLYS